MVYYLTVKSGADEGKAFRVEPGELLIGRSPNAAIGLADDSVAWEHAIVKEEGNRLVLRNLSALGTRVKGQRVTEEVRLGANDEIQLSDRCKLVVEQRLRSRRRPPSPLITALIGVIVLVVLVVGGGWLVWSSQPPPARPITARHWRQAYHRIDDRLHQWSAEGWFPRAVVTVFEDAWRFEQAGSTKQAADSLDDLRSALLSIRMPDHIEGDRTVSQMASPTAKYLLIVMGWDPRGASTSFEWTTDEAFADALVWFVKERGRLTRKQANAR